MLTVKRAASTTPGSAPTRPGLAQSTATRTRSPKSVGRSRCRPRSSSSRNRYSPGSGAGPPRYITTSLPSCSNPSPIASREPRASPSGASCEVTTKRSFSRRAAAAACRSGWFDIGVRRSELVDQLGEPYAPLDRGIVCERQDRRSPGAELARDLRLENSVRRLQAREGPFLLVVRPEHADEDRRLREVRRRDDARHRDEPDARVLQRRQRLREHLANRLVHLPPSLSARQGRPPLSPCEGAPTPESQGTARRRRAAPVARSARGSRTRRPESSAARGRDGRPR